MKPNFTSIPSRSRPRLFLGCLVRPSAWSPRASTARCIVFDPRPLETGKQATGTRDTGWVLPVRSGLAQQIIAQQIIETPSPGFVGVAANVDAPGELHLTGFGILHV